MMRVRGSHFVVVASSLVLLMACTSAPIAGPQPEDLRPEVAAALNSQIAQLKAENRVLIERCMNWNGDTNHVLCEATYSLILREDADTVLTNAVAVMPKSRPQISFKVRESYGSELFGAFIRGLGEALAQAAFGG